MVLDFIGLLVFKNWEWLTLLGPVFPQQINDQFTQMSFSPPAVGQLNRPKWTI